MLSQTPGFFSTAVVTCPVTGEGLVCRALAIAESNVLSELEGPTPNERNKWEVQVEQHFHCGFYVAVVSLDQAHPVGLWEVP